MERELRKIHSILYDMDVLTENEYNSLISIYSKNVVDKAIDDIMLYEDDERNLIKFKIYLDNKISDLEKTADMSIYEIYLMDVNSQVIFNSDMNDKYMKIIIELKQLLETLFAEAGCDDSILPGKRIPWVVDKVNYCLAHCSDKFFLDRLSKTYDKFCYYRDMIVAGNLRLVIGLSSDYHNDNKISFEDIIQWGNIGLMQAVEKFKPETGAIFTTCAGYWIKQNITKNLRQASYPLRMPLYMIYQNYNRLTMRYELSSQLGREATNKEVSEFMGETEEKIGKISMLFAEPLNLDETTESRYGDVELTFGDMIPDDKVDVYKEAVNSLYREYLEKTLAMYLTTRELEVLKHKTGFNCECINGEDIAILLGISEQRVSQLWCNGIKKLTKIPNIRNVIID